MRFMILIGKGFVERAGGKRDECHFEFFMPLAEMETTEDEIKREYDFVTVHFHNIVLLSEEDAWVMYPEATKGHIEQSSKKSKEPKYVEIKE